MESLDWHRLDGIVLGEFGNPTPKQKNMESPPTEETLPMNGPADAPPPDEEPKNKGGRPKGSKNPPGDTRKPKVLKLDKVRFREMPHVSHVGNSNTVTSEKDGLLELDTELRVVIWHTGRNFGTVIIPLESVEFAILAAKE